MSEQRERIERAGRGAGLRLILASLGAAVVSLPFAWLLSYLAYNFLGLFFFTLAGLIFGALAYRGAKSVAPISRMAAGLMSIFIVGTCWLTSIVVEARALPHLVAERQLEVRRLPEGVTRDEYYEKQMCFAAERMKAEAWPGGVFGYIRWVVTDGELDLRDGDGPAKFYQAKQKSWWWIGRSAFSIALLGFGVFSQIKGLTAKRIDPSVEAAATDPTPSSTPEVMDAAAQIGG